MTDPLDDLRRQAKTLQKRYETGDRDAIARVDLAQLRRDGALKHADFLHIVARENNFTSWPQMKTAVETRGMDRAAKVQRLKIALAHGQTEVVQQLIWDTPDLADGAFCLQVALYDLPAVRAALVEDPQLATKAAGGRRPILHLSYSPMLRGWPERQADMLAIADLLHVHGADVNDSYTPQIGADHPLSALYGAIGHAQNMPMARWLLDRGANPNDGESLYHATEMGHDAGVRILLAAGADPTGTNALLRAMDADDAGMVQLLLDAGADPNEDNGAMTALHHAALRMCSPQICQMLLAAGADQTLSRKGVTVYACSRVYGNAALSDMLDPTPLSKVETLLATAADQTVPDATFVDTAQVPEVFTNILRDVLHLPGKLAHVQALVGIGMPWDKPDDMGVTPVQSAGWEGLPEMMAYLLALKPDLGHINHYGGTLLSTIIHGSENNPTRASRDYLGCLELALKEGVALPKRAIDLAGAPDVAAFLAEWAARFPGQVVEHGIA
ncbi:ankyrin repeat domain-containing protein [Loktanella sp. Alg231-35]|uniref:ankyrin repeat domain-containing protein n=1 Tax=Loktanella sp. Alg231-35 TaxID=1922220 RepID=UPI000D55E05D|nr:ankyrin repeat domain-containing protein [Loktanella sp. Alg231-35]